MQALFRSDLFVISDRCSCGEACELCQSMGYVRSKALDESSINEYVDALNSSPGVYTVIPSASFLNPHFFKALPRLQKRLKFVFTLKYYQQNHEFIKKTFSGNSICILSDSFQIPVAQKFPLDSTLCLLLHQQNEGQLRDFMVLRFYSLDGGSVSKIRDILDI